jgi:hypothetical protein
VPIQSLLCHSNGAAALAVPLEWHAAETGLNAPGTPQSATDKKREHPSPETCS